MSNKRPRPRPSGRARPRARRSAGISPWVLVTVAVVVLGGAAVLLAGGGAEDGSEATAPVDVIGAELTKYDSNQPADPAVGRAAPEVEGEALDGSPLAFKNVGPRVVIFLAHWCPHCQVEVADLTAYAKANPLPEGVDVQSVSTLADRRRENFPPRDWLEAEGWPFPVLVDDDEASVGTAYGLAGTPHWVFIDAEGRVVERVGGEIPPEMVAAAMQRLADGHTAADGPVLRG